MMLETGHFILLQMVDQFSQHHLLKRLSFLCCIFLPPLSKIRYPYYAMLSHVSHVQFSDPMDYSPPGSSIHGIFQARVLEWGAIIQCNPYQATNGILHRARTNNFTICMEIQKTSNSQSNLEKEEWKWRNQPAWLQTLLQSHTHQDSMVLAQRQKYRSMEQNRKSIDKSMDTVSLTKEARIYNREKTISLTSGAGKTGQLLVKERN